MNIKEYFAPRENIDVILDTDTYNEIDDQFAIAYMCRNRDRINVKGITIAPFRPNQVFKKAANAEESIPLSYNEAISVLKLSGNEDIIPNVKKGCPGFLKDEKTVFESEAVDFIISTSKAYTSENRLFIVAIGAITNVASAIIKDPSIVDRISIVWLGGSAYTWYINREFNMYQDIAAARVVMSANCPFAQLPCQGVVSTFITTKPELLHYLSNKNPLCDKLMNYAIESLEEVSKVPTWSKCIWDVCAIAFLLNDKERFMKVTTEKCRIPNYDERTYDDPIEKEIAYVVEIKRDVLMNDLFTKLTK